MRATIEPRLRECVELRIQFFESCLYGTAPRMPQHDHQTHAVPLGGELDAADLRRGDDVAGHADHEQVAQALVEHDLHRHARVGAAEDDGERFLALDELTAPRVIGQRVEARRARYEAAVAFSQSLERFAGSNRRHG